MDNSKSGSSSIQGKVTIEIKQPQVQLYVVPQLYPVEPPVKSRRKKIKKMRKNKKASQMEG
ncbi:hypothetical protein IW18_02515 [Flavobacterium hibernum]|uniref:Uncharacterized protein n=1 Tax=Flavobacterium hibernum TaxID=37752 RepID=A0A0D0EZ57_9FLAO|nr:hypothetical protein IW18_02515 [Flavobacterium hibernum]OXA88187.1 hypothetical protein B0A73_10480 [Flavobacterium hibernum]